MAKSKNLSKRIFCILLSFIFIFSSFPAFTSTGGTAPSATEDENAFEAIGIDTSVVPAGVDLNSNENPYGKDRVNVIPVYELFEGSSFVDSPIPEPEPEPVEGSEGEGDPVVVNDPLDDPAYQNATVYGDGSKMLDSKTNFYNAQGQALTQSGALTPGGYAAFSGISGDFTGSGQKNKIVTVAAGNWNHAPVEDEDPLTDEGKIAKGAYAGLYLYLTDPETGAVSTVKNILSTNRILGNIGRFESEDFVNAPYQLQNYLQVTSGDYNGDGIDEIAVYIPDGADGSSKSNSRVEVYRLKYTNTAGNLPSDNYLDASDWELAWSYPFQEGTYVSNMVSLLSGDFNRDGTDDLAISWGVYYSKSYKTTSKAAVLYGSKTSSMLSVIKPFDLSYGSSQLVRAAFAYADINGDNVDELILGAQAEDDINAGFMHTRVINVYAYNGPLDQFMRLSTDNFSLVTQINDNGDTVRRGDGKYYSSPGMVANIAPIRFEGRTKNYMIYLDSVIYAYGDEGLGIYDMLEDSSDGGSSVLLDTTRMNDFELKTLEQIEISKYYTEYGAENGDFTGNSLESLHLSQYFLSQEVKTTWDDDWYWYSNSFWWFSNLSFWSQFYFTGAVSHKEEGLLKTYALYANVDGNYNISGLNAEILHRAEGKLDQYYTLLNMDNDTAYMEYGNRHYIRYTDPEVLAVMASAPYFADVAQMDGGDDHVGNSSTSFTSSDGTGTGTTRSDTLSIGTYFGIEQDFEVFGVTVGSFEMELAYRHDWTWEMAESSSMTQSITYTSIAGQDSVAFYSIPMEIYEYDLYTPITDEDDTIIGYQKQIIALNIPHNASKSVLSLDQYESIAADYPELPQISGTVLKHTIGEPASYPSSTVGYENPIEFNSLSLVGYGDSAITQEIEMSTETEKAYVNTNAVDFKIGGGVSIFKAGVTVGYEGSRGKVTVSTSGSTYAATIVNMPVEASDFQYSYAWKLFTYLYRDGERAFPVVNFVVKDVVEPPKLPGDFYWDPETATSTELELTWSYKGNVSAFNIFRQYDFSGEKKLVQIATVPASEIVGLAPDGLTKLYRYKVTGLSPYQDYGFSIQVTRQTVPLKSARSALLLTRTKTDSGYPDITLSSNEILVYPDTPGTVSVNVTYEGQPGTAVYKSVLYQWQKKIDGVWTNLSQLSNYTTETLKLENSGIATAGDYRCRVYVIYYDEIRGDEYNITAYSLPVAVAYQKRSSKMNTIQTDDTNLTKPGLSIVVENPHSDSVKAPLGMVTFVFKGMDYETSYTASLNKIGTGKTSEAIIAPNTISELPVGIYEITAYYSGDRYFRSNVSEAIMYKSGSEPGYWLELSKEAQYGDVLTPVLNQVTGQGHDASKTVVTSGITYNVVGQTGWVSDKTITAKAAGTVIVTATVDHSVVAEKSMVVKPYPLTLKAYSDELVVNTDDIIHPSINTVALFNTNSQESIGSLPNGDTLSALGLYVQVENTAYEEGTFIKHDPEDKSEPSGTPTYGDHWFYQPGNYTAVAAVLEDPSNDVNELRAKALANYEITYIKGNYRLISGAYDVVTVARLLNGQVRGTIEVREPQGYVEGTQYQSGTQLKFEALPFEGYEVKAWYLANSLEGLATALPYEEADLIHTGNFLTVNMKSEPVYVAVEFRIAQVTLTYKANDAAFGSVENLDSPHLVSGAVFFKGTEYHFKANPNVGYHFKDWAITGAATHAITEDTAIVTGDKVDVVVQANFERDFYPIHLIGDLQAVYTSDLDGDQTTPDQKVIALDGAMIPGDEEVTIMPKSGFSILSWINVVSDSQTYTFTMLEETTIEAETDYKGFEVLLNVTQASIAGSEVIVNQDITDYIVGGSTVTLEARPTYGAVFKGFKVNGKEDFFKNKQTPEPDEALELSNDGRTLTIKAIGINYDIEAVFDDNTPRILTLNKGAHGTLNLQVSNTLYGTINNPSMDYNIEKQKLLLTVYDGDELTLTVVPETGFQVIYWKEDANLIQSDQAIYYPSVIAGDKMLTVDFGAMGYYTVTYSAMANGSMVYATVDGVPFESGNDTIGAGTLLAFNALPDSGFMVDYWTINDVVVQNDYGHVHVGEDLIFVIGQPSDVKVYFKEIIKHEIAFTGSHYDKIIETVTPMTLYDVNTETGIITVRDGAYGKFKFVPVTGYYIEKIMVNGLENDFDKLVQEPWSPEATTGESWVSEMYAIDQPLAIEVVTRPVHLMTLSMAMSTAKLDVTGILPYNGTFQKSSLSTDGTYAIRDGSTAKLIFTPKSGYKITDIAITGSSAYTLTAGANNTPWMVEFASFDVSTTLTATTSTYVTPDPGPGPNPPSPEPFVPFVTIEEDLVPLGISRLEGTTLFEIEFIKQGLISVGELSLEDGDLILEEVIGQKSLRIVLTNKDPILTDRLKLTLPKASLEKWFNETETTLEIVLDLANLIVSRETLAKLVDSASGEFIELTMSRVNVNTLDPGRKALVGRHPVVRIGLTSDAKAVSFSPQKWTIELPYTLRKGEMPERIAVFAFRTDNTLKRMMGSSYDETLGFVTFETDVVGDFLIKHEWISPFIDVEPSAWYYDFIFTVHANGLMNGVAANRFDPARNATRGMIATMLYQLDGALSTGDSLFNDVPGNAWYAKGVVWAVQNGIFSGYEDKTFRPNADITREQLATVIYNYLESMNLASPSTGNLNAFSDKDEVSAYAVEAMTWMVENGYMSGKGNGILDPKGFASRAEVAAMFDKLIE